MGWKVLRKHGASCVCSLRRLHGNGAAATKPKNLHCVASAFRRAQPGSPAGGRVCRHPPDGPRRRSRLPPQDPGCLRILGWTTSAYGERLDQWPQFQSPTGRSIWALPCALLAHQARAGSGRWVCGRAVGAACGHRLWVLRGQSRGPPGQGGHTEGSGVAPPLLHQCQTHAPRARPGPPAPGASPASRPRRGRSLSPRETEASYRLLIGTPRWALLSQGAGTWPLARLRPADSAGTRLRPRRALGAGSPASPSVAAGEARREKNPGMV